MITDKLRVGTAYQIRENCISTQDLLSLIGWCKTNDYSIVKEEPVTTTLNGISSTQLPETLYFIRPKEKGV